MNVSHFYIVSCPVIISCTLSNVHFILICSCSSSFSRRSSYKWASNYFIWSSLYSCFYYNISICLCHSVRLILKSYFHFWASFYSLSIVVFMWCLNSSPAFINSYLSVFRLFSLILSVSINWINSSFFHNRELLSRVFSCNSYFIYAISGSVLSALLMISQAGYFLRYPFPLFHQIRYSFLLQHLPFMYHYFLFTLGLISIINFWLCVIMRHRTCYYLIFSSDFLPHIQPCV